jgi:hypothetical protein
MHMLTNCEVEKLKAEILAYFDLLEYGIFQYVISSPFRFYNYFSDKYAV